MNDLNQLIQSALDEVENSEDIKILEEVRVKLLGKAGTITQELKNLSKYSVEEKKTYGKQLNIAKAKLLESIESKKITLENKELESKLSKEFTDCTLPTRDSTVGVSKVHPVSQTINEIVSILGDMGLTFQEGPDVEDDFNNFTALNIPKNHPARQMHDTFYLKNSYQNEKLVLRTHTSPVQIRTLKKKNFL